jgi:hypothetical protein
MGLVKLVHLPKNMTMGLPDGFKGCILPKVIPISDFNIGETFVVIRIQRVKKEILILCKVVCPAVIPPVTIAKKNEFRRIIKRDLFG